MKIKLDIEATAVEMRTFFGLPDVSVLHDELLNALREKMHAGVEGYDPLTLISTFLPQGVQGVEAMQKMFWEAMRQNLNIPGSGAKR